MQNRLKQNMVILFMEEKGRCTLEYLLHCISAALKLGRFSAGFFIARKPYIYCCIDGGGN